jgi:hypothetical protein
LLVTAVLTMATAIAGTDIAEVGAGAAGAWAVGMRLGTLWRRRIVVVVVVRLMFGVVGRLAIAFLGC